MTRVFRLVVRAAVSIAAALAVGCFVAMGTGWLTEPAYWFGRVEVLLMALGMFIALNVWAKP